MIRLSVGVLTLALVLLRAESRYVSIDQTHEFFNEPSSLFSNAETLQHYAKYAPLDVLMAIIRKVNEVIQKEQAEYMKIPGVSFNAIVGSISTGEGRLGQFSTLVLHGNDQKLRKTYVKDAAIYNFDLRLGMENLNIQYPYAYKLIYFFGSSGMLQVNSKDDAIRVRGVVNLNENGTCTAYLRDVKMTDMGQHMFDITPQNIPSRIFFGFIKFITNKILPLFLPAVNYMIGSVVAPHERVIDFSKLICDRVLPEVGKLF